jgi:hypothetical protein
MSKFIDPLPLNFAITKFEITDEDRLKCADYIQGCVARRHRRAIIRMGIDNDDEVVSAANTIASLKSLQTVPTAQVLHALR